MSNEKFSEKTKNSLEFNDSSSKSNENKRRVNKKTKIFKKFRVKKFNRSEFLLKNSQKQLKNNFSDLEDINEIFLRQKADSNLKLNYYELNSVKRLIKGLKAHNFSSKVTSINYQPFFNYEVFSINSEEEEKEPIIQETNDLNILRDCMFKPDMEFYEEE